jgi:hypothetical protein
MGQQTIFVGGVSLGRYGILIGRHPIAVGKIVKEKME